MLDAFISAVHLGSGWRLVLFFAFTALYWTLTAAGLGILGPGFGFDSLTPLLLAVMLTIQVAGVMVPAGPGAAGSPRGLYPGGGGAGGAPGVRLAPGPHRE